MRKVIVDKIEDGLVLARPLMGATGNILLGEGVVLKASMISRLKNWDVPFVYVQSEVEQTEDSSSASGVPVSTDELDEIFTDVMKNPIMKIIYDAAKEYSKTRAATAS